MNYQQFEFVVEEMTAEQALALFENIIDQVEGMGLQMGGGVYPTSDFDYELPWYLRLIERIQVHLIRARKRAHRRRNGRS